MRCEEVQQQISDGMDGGPALTDELHRHIKDCAACAAFERDCRALDILLTAGRLGAPVAAPRRWRGRLLAAAGFAAAAMIFLALLPLWRPAPRPAPNPGPHPQLPQFDFVPDIAQRATQVVETVAVAPIRHEMDSLVADARTATRSLLSCLPSPPAQTSTRAVQ